MKSPAVNTLKDPSLAVNTHASTKFLKSNLPGRNVLPFKKDFFKESSSSRSRHDFATRRVQTWQPRSATYHPLVPDAYASPSLLLVHAYTYTNTRIETLDGEGEKKKKKKEKRKKKEEKMYLPSQFAPVGVAGWKLFSKSSLKQLCKRWPILQSRRVLGDAIGLLEPATK